MDKDTSTPKSSEPTSSESETIYYPEVVSSRGREAYELKLSGKSLSEIAEALDFNSTSEVVQAMNGQMRLDAQFITEQGRQGILQMELDRLDRLQEKCWPAAMMGDPRSVEAVLKIMDRRIKITGLDSVDTQTQQHTVLVVGGQEQDYIKKLKELSDE